MSFQSAWPAALVLPQTHQPSPGPVNTACTAPCSRSPASLSQLALILLSACFQEEDLNCVRERWSEALIKRREYLDEQIKKIINKHGESPALCYSYHMKDRVPARAAR